MCPSSVPPTIELHEDSTDETVIMSLLQLKSGLTLPSNVLADVDPFHFSPLNLPAGMWYFGSGSKTDPKNGFWRPAGEACEIYNTSLVIGQRRTLQFYEGPAHDGQKTNWMMQEYTTTEKCISKMDPRALYRVFLVNDSGSGSGHLSESELRVKNGDGMAGPSDVADLSSDQLLDDYVLGGDFLELGDLTNSAGSSCTTMSMTSEEGFEGHFDPHDLLSKLVDDTVNQENQDSRNKMSMTPPEGWFDPDDLLRQLGADPVDQENQDSRVKLNISVAAESKPVVIQQPTIGSLDVEESKPRSGQASKTNPTPENKKTSNEADTSSPPPPPSPPPSSPSPPSTSPPPPSSNGSESSSKEEKKDRANRTKKRKMMKYLCFLAF